VVFWDKLKRNEWWLIMSVIITGALLMSIKIVDNFLDKDGLTILDSPINQLMVWIRVPWMNQLMLLVSTTASWQMILWGTWLGSILLAAAKKWRYLTAMLLSNATAVIFIQLAKMITGRERPPVEMAVITEHGFAFPSGHSYLAVVFYGLLTYFWVKHLKLKWEKILMLGIGIVFVMMLGFSRIYLGVHWTTDVLAGLSISLTWLGVIITYLEYKNRYLVTEYQSFNRKMVWRGFWLFLGFWLLGLGWRYYKSGRILGVNMRKPITTEVIAMIRTAPAARSRGSAVAW